MAKTRKVEVGWEHGGEEFRVVCSYTPGSPARGPRYDCAGEPADPPEVEILEVREDAPGGALRPDLLAAAEKDFARLQDLAAEVAEEDDGYDGADTMEEARGER